MSPGGGRFGLYVVLGSLALGLWALPAEKTNRYPQGGEHGPVTRAGPELQCHADGSLS